MGHALATLPTSSNGTSVTDNESSRQSLRTSLPRRSSCEASFCHPVALQDLFFFSNGGSSSTPPSSFPTSVPSRKRLTIAIVAYVIPSSSFSHTLACRTSQSNICLAEVMGALCVVIYQPHGVLLVACEFPERGLLSYTLHDPSLTRPTVLHLWSMKVVVMPMMLIMRCITNALDGTTF